MATERRLDEIMAEARHAGRVRAEALSARFGVSVQTVRRDLNALAARGLLKRVHGGAVLPSGTRNTGHAFRRHLNAPAKARIGRAVARRVPDGASVFLDIGTTCEAVAEALTGHENLLVVTNNINVANILTRNPSAEILLAGGILRHSDGALVGEVTADFVRQFKVDIAILGTSAIDADGDALDFDFREVRVGQAVMGQARRSFLAADSSKLGRTAPVRLAGLADFDLWATDAPPPDALAERCARGRTGIVLPGEGEA